MTYTRKRGKRGQIRFAKAAKEFPIARVSVLLEDDGAFSGFINKP